MKYYKVCTIEGCDRPHHGKGFCKLHYLRWHEHGDPLIVLKPVNRIGPGPCSIPGCEKPRIARGWCSMHYMRWREHGDVNWEPPTPRLCSIDGCDQSHMAHGYCRTHWARWKEHGDPLYIKPKRLCDIEGCNEPHVGHGYCRTHHGRWKRHGDPLHVVNLGSKRGASLAERFWPKVNQKGPIPKAHPELGPCWEWIGGHDSGGYSTIVRKKGEPVSAHKVAWELIKGFVPKNKHLHHICENKSCVNPNHLEPLTPSEHTRIHNLK